MKISVVIPAHNEEAIVEKMIKLLLRNFNKDILEIIVINDCSRDKTREILNKLAKQNKKIKPIHRNKNGGVGNAIRLGLKSISSRTEYALLLDCDFLDNINNIKQMIKERKNVDGVIGSRYMENGRLHNYPLMKRLANRSFHFLTKFILGVSQIDVTNNFKFYKREIIERINPYLRSDGFSINAETGLLPVLLGYRIKEMPVVWIGRREDMGSSNFNIVKAGPGYFKVFLNMFALKFLKQGERKHLAHDEKKHFDELVAKTGETYYGNLRPIAQVRFQRKAKLILDELRDIKNPKILEYGCGTGILSKYLLQLNPSLHIQGIDISPKAISVAKKTLKKYKNASFQVADALHLPFKDNSFDMVVGNSILHHIPLQESLQEIKRILKPNGKIWFCEPNMLNPQIAVEKNVPFLKSFFQDSEDERAFSKWGIKKDLQRSGFKKVVVQPFEFLHPLFPASTLKIAVPFCIMLENIPLVREFAGTMWMKGINTKKK